MMLLIIFVIASMEFKVERVEIHGNEQFDNGRIKRIMLTKTPSLFRPGILNSEIFAGDITAIRNLYHYNGYLNVDVTYDLAFDSLHNTVAIDISIKENDRTFCGTIGFEGNTHLSDEELHRAITMTPGEPFDQRKMDFDNYAITSRYDDQGYAEATVRSEKRIADHRAHITHRITEGKKQFVHSIEIEGLERTMRSSVEREIILNPGDVFRYALVLKSQRNLYNLGIFKSIRVDIKNGPQSDQKIVRFVLTEKKAIHADLRFGYGTRDRLRLGAGVTHNNMFGRVWLGELEGKASFIEYRASTRLTFPRFFMLPVRHSVGAFFQIRKEIGFKTRTAGAHYDLHFPLAAGLFTTQYKIDRTHTWYSDPTLDEDTWIHGISFNWIRDTRNDPLSTRTGEYVVATLETSGILLPADAHYVRPTTEWRIFRPLGSMIAGANVKAGFAAPVLPSTDITAHKRFYCGGATSVRGYSEWTIGPTDDDGNPLGGRVLCEGSLELRVPIYRIFGAAAFLDAGNVWQTYDDIETSLRWGAGIGLRVKTPLGSIRLDYGWKIAPREDESRGMFHFAIGEAF